MATIYHVKGEREREWVKFIYVSQSMEQKRVTSATMIISDCWWWDDDDDSVKGKKKSAKVKAKANKHTHTHESTLSSGVTKRANPSRAVGRRKKKERKEQKQKQE